MELILAELSFKARVLRSSDQACVEKASHTIGREKDVEVARPFWTSDGLRSLACQVSTTDRPELGTRYRTD